MTVPTLRHRLARWLRQLADRVDYTPSPWKVTSHWEYRTSLAQTTYRVTFPLVDLTAKTYSTDALGADIKENE